MNDYEGYVHSNGSVMVKRVPPWCKDGAIDITSPYVKKHLGIYNAVSFTQARKYFEHKSRSKNGKG